MVDNRDQTSEGPEVSDQYGTQSAYLDRVKGDSQARAQVVEKDLLAAFRRVTTEEAQKIINLGGLTEPQIASVLCRYPAVVKSLMAVCNVSPRSIRRDLKIGVDPYAPRITGPQAAQIASYLRPLLPESIALSTLVKIDQLGFIDKEIRLGKGRWERPIGAALREHSGLDFHKRRFRAPNGDDYELDAAYVEEDVIKIGVDVKRIEAVQDMHKRVDEIIRKATGLKERYPKAKFAAIIYYPFPQDVQAKLTRRVTNRAIDAMAFAAENRESVDRAALSVLRAIGIKVRNP